jgi:hypothetical protein
MTVSPEPLAWTCRFEPGGDLDGLQVEPPWFAVYEVRLARGLAKTFAEATLARTASMRQGGRRRDSSTTSHGPLWPWTKQMPLLSTAMHGRRVSGFESLLGHCQKPMSKRSIALEDRLVDPPRRHASRRSPALR